MTRFKAFGFSGNPTPDFLPTSVRLPADWEREGGGRHAASFGGYRVHPCAQLCWTRAKELPELF